MYKMTIEVHDHQVMDLLAQVLPLVECVNIARNDTEAENVSTTYGSGTDNDELSEHRQRQLASLLVAVCNGANTIRKLLAKMKMRRGTIEEYLDIAMDRVLIVREARAGLSLYHITKEGREYIGQPTDSPFQQWSL